MPLFPRPRRNPPTTHVYLDEAGDMSFYGKKRRPLTLGSNGVSRYFVLGLLEVDGDRKTVAAEFNKFLSGLRQNPYFRGVESHDRRCVHPQYWVHAKDDMPEIRHRVFEWLLTIPLRFSAVVIRKDHLQFEEQFERRERQLYAHLLSHVAKPYCARDTRVVFHLAFLGGSTSEVNLQEAFVQAQRLYEREGTLLTGTPDFHNDVQQQSNLPLLGAADYCCWALQRSLERGEHRFLRSIRQLVTELTLLDLDQQRKETSVRFRNVDAFLDHIKKSPHPG